MRTALLSLSTLVLLATLGVQAYQSSHETRTWTDEQMIKVFRYAYENGSSSESALRDHCYSKGQTLDEQIMCVESLYGTEQEIGIIQKAYPGVATDPDAETLTKWHHSTK